MRWEILMRGNERDKTPDEYCLNVRCDSVSCPEGHHSLQWLPNDCGCHGYQYRLCWQQAWRVVQCSSVWGQSVWVWCISHTHTHTQKMTYMPRETHIPTCPHRHDAANAVLKIIHMLKIHMNVHNKSHTHTDTHTLFSCLYKRVVIEFESMAYWFHIQIL